MAENRTPYPDCAAKDRPHGPHRLAGPGGNKPGAFCEGLAEPCSSCGPGYRIGDEGCRHTPTADTEGSE